MKPSDYLGKPVNAVQGRTFIPWDSIGFTVLRVLPNLTGRPWDDIALAYVHSLRPSSLRVIRSTEGTQLDARDWRVTVYLSADSTIKSIDQEVRVGLPDGVSHGAALEYQLDDGPARDE